MKNFKMVKFDHARRQRVKIKAFLYSFICKRVKTLIQWFKRDRVISSLLIFHGQDIDWHLELAKVS